MIATVFTFALIKLLIIFLAAYTGGLLVKYKNVRVNYTRKINHFFLFFVPAFIDKFTGLSESNLGWMSEALLGVGAIIIFLKPLRTRVFFIKTAFSSFDRPEDRPYTVLWYITQLTIGYLITMSAIYIYDKYNMLILLSITILIAAIGDGLAEPIGVRFGKYKYPAYAIFTKRKYVRTVEGSLAILAVGIITMPFFSSFFTQPQFIAAIILIPLVITLAEAFSPHTMDDPLMYLSGFTGIFLIKQFI